MATKQRQPKRVPLTPRPQPDLDAASVVEETSRRYPKTLEYLGR